ncbi:MAG: glycerol-3-phosphate dehydrogenase/oxidase [Vicinamibacteria bacterium]
MGGGYYGACAVRDAAQRGLKAALVERADFCSGTSWNSLKTIHGGLRHLQRLELALLRESVRERRALLRIAPGLLRPLPFLVPAYGHGPKGREALAFGLALNDLLAGDRNQGVPAELAIPAGRMLSPAEVIERAPGVAREGLTGGALWWDAQAISSERLLLAFLRAAHADGARLANHAEATSLLRDQGRVVGALVRDAESGEAFEVRARVVLNAAGPGVDALVASSGIRRSEVPLLCAFNLVLRRPVVRELAIGASSEGRFLFLVPWRDRAMLGTAYGTPGPAGSDALVEGFFEEARRAFPWAGLVRDDVCLVHQGRVPGQGDALWSHSLVVDHEREDGVSGLVSLLGAKLTTARAVAERAIDLVCARLGRTAAGRSGEAPLAHARPLTSPLAEAARQAARDEMALHLDDALLRRLDLGTAGRPSPGDVETVETVLAAELGWGEAALAAERRRLEGALRAARAR